MGDLGGVVAVTPHRVHQRDTVEEAVGASQVDERGMRADLEEQAVAVVISVVDLDGSKRTAFGGLRQ